MDVLALAVTASAGSVAEPEGVSAAACRAGGGGLSAENLLLGLPPPEPGAEPGGVGAEEEGRLPALAEARTPADERRELARGRGVNGRGGWGEDRRGEKGTGDE